MISYKPTVFKQLLGDYVGQIVNVETVDVTGESWYKPDRPNSSPYLLEITFELQDEVSGGPEMYTQKFISPLTGGKGLFQQLLDMLGELPDLEGGTFDEQRLLGLDLMVTMGKNNKGYSQVDGVCAMPRSSKPATKKEKTADEALANILTD